MRIAIVTTFPPGMGSLNEYAYHFIRALQDKSDVSEIILLVDHLPDGQTYPESASLSSSVPIRILPCWNFGAWSNSWTISRAVKRVQPDMVLFNIQFASFADRKIPAALGLLAPMSVKLTGTPTTVLLHNIMETVDLKNAGFSTNPLIESITRFFGRLFTKMLLRADLLAVTIPKYVDILEKEYGADNVFLAPHGAFDTLPEPTLDLPDGPLQIMTFGKLGTYKKVDALIEAFDKIQQAHDTPLELVIAGSDSPNAAGYLDGVKAKYAHIPNIRYTGYVAEEDVPRLFEDAAVVVFPYNSTTGSSGVLHQAGSFGKAVALPNLGDFAELTKDEGYIGEYFEPDDVDTMAEAITRIIFDTPHREEMSKHNFLAAQGLPITDVVDWYLMHFYQLLHKDNQAVATVANERTT